MTAALATLGTVVLCGLLAAQQATLRVGGAVTRELTLTPADIAALPHESLSASAHDQKGTFSGVRLTEILKRAGLPTGDAIRGRELAKFVVVSGADGYRAVFALAELDDAFTDRVVLLADLRDGKPLAANAAPFQLIVPGEKRPARWVRQVVSIEGRDAP